MVCANFSNPKKDSSLKPRGQNFRLFFPRCLYLLHVPYHSILSRFFCLFLGIALATYFLRLQIIILMRGKRSAKDSIYLMPENLELILNEFLPPMDFNFETYEPVVKNDTSEFFP